jgi:hypothetical protein
MIKNLPKTISVQGHAPVAAYFNGFEALVPVSTMLIAPVGHRAEHSPQPVQRSPSCNTVLFFQALVSKASRRNSQAEIQRPHPVQRAGSTCAISAAMV